MKLKFYFIVFILLSLSSCKKDARDQRKSTEIPSLITSYIDSSKNKNLDFIKRRQKLQVAYNLLSKVKRDSLKKHYYSDLVYAYYQLPDTSRFLELNNEVLELAKTTNDSAVIAKCYWRLGNYYSEIQNKKDSAFYYYNKGEEIYWLIGNQFDAAKLLLNMANIQIDIKDYTGSEINTIKAISIFKPLKKYGPLYNSYNSLGIIYDDLGEYDRALYYHRKAFKYIEKSGLINRVSVSLNNMGVVYINQKNYHDAIKNFEDGLEIDSLYHSHPELYAMFLDNLAYAKFKSNDTEAELPELFYNALRIRDSLQFTSGITTSKLHLAEYYLNKNDTMKAIEYARQVKTLSRKSNNFKDLQTSLLILSKIENDSALIYTNDYIRINDSLQKRERAIRNKFARIRFETDEYISETNRLNDRILQTSLISVGLILMIILLFIIYNQRGRNKLIRQRQRANEEIYNLILTQQKNFEEGREKEKQHISRELHDGILGRLFGVRLSLDSLNDENNSDAREIRFRYIEEIQKIAEEIRLISHRLSKSSAIEVDFKIVLEELIDKEPGRIQLKIDNAINWEELDNDIKINFYRIIQEALTNIQKHAKATEAKVEIRRENDQLILQVRDNGVGFKTDQSHSGIGLKNIRNRSNNINAQFSIKSGEEGTLIEVRVNIKYR